MRRNYQYIGLFLCLFLLLPLLLILIPALLVDFQATDVKVNAQPTHISKQEPTIMIDVTLSKEGKVISVPLEDYVRGVVASEMPINFQKESLRAQALTARTYIMKRVKAGRARVTDTIKDQVYATDVMLQKRWGNSYIANKQKINAAVSSTKGQIITYQGKPIYAAFFSTSNGRTENSEDYFEEAYPYLRSVASPWDKQSPKYQREKTISITTVIKKLEAHTKKQIASTTLTKSNGVKVLKRTSGERIAKVRVGDRIFTGRQVREALGLASSDFAWKQKSNKVTFVTYGYGHGVGMSQWGANLLAAQGKTAEQIIHYYYHGVTIQRIK